jgi:hypothetical protein
MSVENSEVHSHIVYCVRSRFRSSIENQDSFPRAHLLHLSATRNEHWLSLYVGEGPVDHKSRIGKSTQNDPHGPFSHRAISGKMFLRSTSSQGAVMNQSNAVNLSQVDRPINAVALQYAVLCADCDVVSDSPHDICMVCGSRSLVNICRILGGKMPKNRAELLKQQEPVKITREIVMHFPKPHRVRRRVSV